MSGWLASPGHCENIMEPRFQHIGVGLATGGKRGQIYWVQTFGEPSFHKVGQRGPQLGEARRFAQHAVNVGGYVIFVEQSLTPAGQ